MHDQVSKFARLLSLKIDGILPEEPVCLAPGPYHALITTLTSTMEDWPLEKLIRFWRLVCFENTEILTERQIQQRASFVVALSSSWTNVEYNILFMRSLLGSFISHEKRLIFMNAVVSASLRMLRDDFASSLSEALYETFVDHLAIE